jgi:SAM-dependent methyltransferase
MKVLEVCPVCGIASADAKLVFDTTASITGTPFHSRLVECRDCTHVYLNPQPTWEELGSFYGESYSGYEAAPEGDAPFRQQITQVPAGTEISHIPVVPGGRFLDIGCGTGDLIAAMATLGMQAEGVEPVRLAVERARRLGRKVFYGTLEEAKYEEDSFDSMSMIHVFEHVPQPLPLLRLCHRILKPGGSITVGVPNFDSAVFRLVGNGWGGLQLPVHLHHFRMRSLEDVARRCRFAIEKSFTESLTPFVERELVNWLRRRFYIPARLLLWTHVMRPIASYVAARGNATGGGEAIVLRLRKVAPWLHG